jgi:S-formylglutathione hydrolase FrmB
VDCGAKDELLQDSREFHSHLDAIGYQHHYEEPPGAHEWSYWDGQIQRVLDWLPIRK